MPEINDELYLDIIGLLWLQDFIDEMKAKGGAEHV